MLHGMESLDFEMFLRPPRKSLNIFYNNLLLDRLLMNFNLYIRHHTPTEHDIEKCPRCEEARIMRRILARWLNLAGVLTFRDVSQCVKDRFPTLDHIKSAGFLTLPELELYENTKTVHLKYWIPFIWFTRNVRTLILIQNK